MVEIVNQERFFQFIKDISKQIREQSLDREQINFIVNTFNKWFRLINSLEATPRELTNDIEALLEFQISLEIAYSNYRKSNPKKSIWEHISRVKISAINIPISLPDTAKNKDGD